MAYDEELGDRVRARLSDRADIVEKRMFGGLAFLVNGHMACAASGRGGLMVRIEPDETDAALAEAGVEPMEMGGRGMRGWIRVAAESVDDEAGLARWVDRGVAFAAGLPPK